MNSFLSDFASVKIHPTEMLEKFAPSREHPT